MYKAVGLLCCILSFLWVTRKEGADWFNTMKKALRQIEGHGLDFAFRICDSLHNAIFTLKV